MEQHNEEPSCRMVGNKLVGTAAVYNQRSLKLTEKGRSFYEILKPGAFSESLKQDNVTFTYKHNDDAVYGDTATGSLRLLEDDKGLHFELETPAYAVSLREAVTTGKVKGMSIAFKKTAFRTEGDTDVVNKGKLFHVAAVTGTPAYPQTRVSLRSKDKRRRKLTLLRYIHETDHGAK